MSSRPPFPWNPGRSSAHSPKPLRRFRVVLHRSADAGLTAVMRTVRDLTRFGEAEATHRMWEVHHRGRADVLVTHLERAELYVEQFADRGMVATVEPA